MDFNTFSLIYPNEELRKKHDSGEYVPDIDLFTLQELGLLEVFNLKNRDLSEFFTMDAEVIRYRIATFDDMMRCAKMENGRSAFLSSKLWELMSILLEKGPVKADYTTKALSYMHAEYAGGISVKDVADRLSLDRSYFSTIFR